MSAPFERSMTAEERKFLASHLSGPGFLTNLGTGVFLAVILTAYSYVLLGIVILVARLAGFVDEMREWRQVASVLWTARIVIACFVLFFLWGIGKRFVPSERKNIGLKEKVRVDLATGSVLEENVAVSDVKRFREPEHYGEFYAILLTDCRVLVLYDYASPNMEGGGPRRSAFRLGGELRIVTFPHSGLKSFEFEGDPIRRPRARMVTAHPDQWPEGEEWCGVTWDQLDAKLTAPP